MDPESPKPLEDFAPVESDPVTVVEEEIQRSMIAQAQETIDKLSALLVPGNGSTARVLRLITMTAAHYKRLLGHISAPDSIPKRMRYTTFGGNNDEFGLDESMTAQPVSVSGEFAIPSPAETSSLQY